MNWRLLLRTPALRRAGHIGSHLVLTAAGYYAAFALRFDFRIPPNALERFGTTLPVLLLVRLVLAHRFRLDRGYWAHVGVRDLVQLPAAATVGSLVFPAALYALRELHDLPVTVLGLEWLLGIVLTGGVRLAARCWREGLRSSPPSRGKRTLTPGAGGAGGQNPPQRP